MWEFVSQADWIIKRGDELSALCPSVVPLAAWHKRLLADDPCWRKPRIRLVRDMSRYQVRDPVGKHYGLPLAYVPGERRSAA